MNMNTAALRVFLKDLLRRAGWEVQKLKYVNSEETVLRNLFSSVEPAAVLDVGANCGQFAQLVRKLGFRGSIVSFEALPDAHAVLRMASQHDFDWKVAPCAALGSQAGEVEINIARNSVSSSVLPMRASHTEVAPDSVYVGKQKIRMQRLDALVDELLPGQVNLFLKIDTQGYEREVLKGATSILGRVAVIQTEMSLVPLYEGAPGFAEMVAFIEGLGYEIFSIVPGFRNAVSGQLLQVDGFFVRQLTE